MPQAVATCSFMLKVGHEQQEQKHSSKKPKIKSKLLKSWKTTKSNTKNHKQFFQATKRRIESQRAKGSKQRERDRESRSESERDIERKRQEVRRLFALFKLCCCCLRQKGVKSCACARRRCPLRVHRQSESTAAAERANELQLLAIRASVCLRVCVCV